MGAIFSASKLRGQDFSAILTTENIEKKFTTAGTSSRPPVQNLSSLLGNSQLIPGMADFSQGVFHQSVGRVKKKKKKRTKNYKPTPNNP